MAGGFVHPIEFGTSFTNNPGNLIAVHEKGLAFFLEEVEFEIGEVIAEEFAVPFHAKWSEGVTRLWKAEGKWTMQFFGIEVGIFG